MPAAGWQAPARLAAGGTVVTVYAEAGDPAREFDFATFPVAHALQRAFADAFAVLTAPDGPHRSIHTMQNNFGVLRRFARLLAAAVDPPRSAGELTVGHLTAVRLVNPRDHRVVKVCLRKMPGITPTFHAALTAPNGTLVRKRRVLSLTKGEFAAVMAAARRDLRLATDRIRFNRSLLHRLHEGVLVDGSDEKRRAEIVEYVSRHADVPRYPGGSVLRTVLRLGTISSFRQSLFLTHQEIIAGAVLLAGLTGQNFAAIDGLTIDHQRADGDDVTSSTPVAIVDVYKPRRGRRRRYMTAALTHLPDWIAAPEEVGTDTSDDLLTAFGVFRRLCELTADGRSMVGSRRLFTGHFLTGGPLGGHFRVGIGAKGGLVALWARRHRLVAEAATGGLSEPLRLTWPRLRMTFIQLHQRGVAHTDVVLLNDYLGRDRGNLSEYQTLVSDILLEQERKAREYGLISTLSDADLEKFAIDPEGTSGRLGVARDRLEALLDGRLDTVFAGCTDNAQSPYSSGPCRESFFLCLSCPNARATPAHLPAQAQAHHRLLTLRAETTPRQWAERFALPEAQLRHLLSQHTPTQVDDARHAADAATIALIDRLLSGELDTP